MKKNNPLFIMIKDFLTDFLPKKRNCSSNTIRAYKNALNQLLDFVKVQKGSKLYMITMNDLNHDIICEFLDYLEIEKNCSVKTRNHRLNCLRSFFNYASMVDPLYVSYYTDICQIPLKKTEKVEIIDYLKESAIKSILCQPDINSEKGIRNQFFMILMYDTAARVQEMLDLRICDIRLGSTPQVKVHGKGNKYRSIPLMNETVNHYQRYLKIFHRNESDKSDKPLFYTIRNNVCRPMSAATVRVFMNQYAAKAHPIDPDVPEKIHPHLFRHSRAMHLYQHGMDLMLISQWLGHSDFSTTLMYAHADTEMKRIAIEKATGKYYTSVSPIESQYDINDDDVLKRLYGLKP